MESREHAERLVKYFERIASENENREVWQKGLTTAQEWLRLIDSENISQEELSNFIRVIHANKSRTSGWYDLASGAYHWAHSKGFALPKVKDFFDSENLPSTTFEKVTFEEHAEILVKHFGKYLDEDPHSLAWKIGLKSAQEWQRLL